MPAFGISPAAQLAAGLQGFEQGTERARERERFARQRAIDAEALRTSQIGNAININSEGREQRLFPVKLEGEGLRNRQTKAVSGYYGELGEATGLKNDQTRATQPSDIDAAIAGNQNTADEARAAIALRPGETALSRLETGNKRFEAQSGQRNQGIRREADDFKARADRFTQQIAAEANKAKLASGRLDNEAQVLKAQNGLINTVWDQALTNPESAMDYINDNDVFGPTDGAALRIDRDKQTLTILDEQGNVQLDEDGKPRSYTMDEMRAEGRQRVREHREKLRAEQAVEGGGDGSGSNSSGDYEPKDVRAWEDNLNDFIIKAAKDRSIEGLPVDDELEQFRFEYIASKEKPLSPIPQAMAKHKRFPDLMRDYNRMTGQNRSYDDIVAYAKENEVSPAVILRRMGVAVEQARNAPAKPATAVEAVPASSKPTAVPAPSKPLSAREKYEVRDKTRRLDNIDSELQGLDNRRRELERLIKTPNRIPDRNLANMTAEQQDQYFAEVDRWNNRKTISAEAVEAERKQLEAERKRLMAQ